MKGLFMLTNFENISKSKMHVVVLYFYNYLSPTEGVKESEIDPFSPSTAVKRIKDNFEVVKCNCICSVAHK